MRIYELLMEWEEELSLDDFVRLVGGIELILRIRDKIVGDVGMKNKIELREKIKDKIEFEKDVK